MVGVVQQQELIGLLGHSIGEVVACPGDIIPLRGAAVVPLPQLYVVPIIPVVPDLEVSAQVEGRNRVILAKDEADLEARCPRDLSDDQFNVVLVVGRPHIARSEGPRGHVKGGSLVPGDVA